MSRAVSDSSYRPRLRFRAHLPPENVIRYEDLVESDGSALFRRLGDANAEPVRLESNGLGHARDYATVVHDTGSSDTGTSSTGSAHGGACP